MGINCLAKSNSNEREAASSFLRHWIEQSRDVPCDLPSDPSGLRAWSQQQLADVGQQYRAYLSARKSRGRRQYFHSRSHALSFLRAVAPTKLVDGAWLFGLLNRWNDPTFSDLVFTYVEELGDGAPDRNHVLLYRRLLQSHGIDDWQEQPDASYVQGTIQLALATCPDEFLPEIIGFNLAYEQLPLHLLVTAYELDELGIDPTYFSLHVTVDNAAGGHAERALRATQDALAVVADKDRFWSRVRDGFRLADAGLSTTQAIASFDLHDEMVRVLGTRANVGSMAHSDYCRIEGRTVNEWLADPEGVAGFLHALERKGWIGRDIEPGNSRFWRLLQGEHAQMFGVFGDYELQVIHDWLRGGSAYDGASFAHTSSPQPPVPHRIQRRRAGQANSPSHLISDSDLVEVRLPARNRDANYSDGAQVAKLMGPAMHWTAAGLEATRVFSQQIRAN